MEKPGSRLWIRYLSGLYSGLCTTWQYFRKAEWMASTWSKYRLWTSGMGWLYHFQIWSNFDHYACLDDAWRGYQKWENLALSVPDPETGRGLEDDPAPNSTTSMCKGRTKKQWSSIH